MGRDSWGALAGVAMGAFGMMPLDQIPDSIRWAISLAGLFLLIISLIGLTRTYLLAGDPFDFDKWRGRDRYKRFEVACLLAGVEPQKPLPWLAKQKDKRIEMALQRREIFPVSTVRGALAAALAASKGEARPDSGDLDIEFRADDIREWLQNSSRSVPRVFMS